MGRQRRVVSLFVEAMANSGVCRRQLLFGSLDGHLSHSSQSKMDPNEFRHSEFNWAKRYMFGNGVRQSEVKYMPRLISPLYRFQQASYG